MHVHTLCLHFLAKQHVGYFVQQVILSAVGCRFLLSDVTLGLFSEKPAAFVMGIYDGRDSGSSPQGGGRWRYTDVQGYLEDQF